MMAKAKRGTGLAWAQEAARYTGDECILWPFGKNAYGYGALNDETGKKWPAHRYVCRLAHGEPYWIWNQAAHRCGNRACCNPRHIRWTTRAENEADKKGHGTSNRGERHGMATLTEADVLAIRALRRAGIRRIDVARIYKIAPTSVYEIASGRRWAWLKGEAA